MHKYKKSNHRIQILCIFNTFLSNTKRSKNPKNGLRLHCPGDRSEGLSGAVAGAGEGMRGMGLFQASQARRHPTGVADVGYEISGENTLRTTGRNQTPEC